MFTETERYERVCNIWSNATEEVADVLMESLDSLNNLFIMANSGARGSKKQISQVGGMRGLMANATGKTIEIPIKANFREGLSVPGIFHIHQRCKEGSGGYSPQNCRLGLSDQAFSRCFTQCNSKRA